jgi:hypothetical protein
MSDHIPTAEERATWALCEVCGYQGPEVTNRCQSCAAAALEVVDVAPWLAIELTGEIDTSGVTADELGPLLVPEGVS